MSSWTNITIPEQYGSFKKCLDQIEQLKFELEQRQKECTRLYRELDNIFRAAKQYKKIEITSGNETIILCLVEATP